MLRKTSTPAETHTVESLFVIEAAATEESTESVSYTHLDVYKRQIVYGDDKGNLNPKSSITRAEACAIIMRAASMKGDLKPYEPTVTEQPKPQTTRKGGVSENGALHVDGTQLMNENNEPVVLHGMSSHGLQWFGNFATENAVKATADYGANLFRCAMYTDEGGYISNPSVKDTLINAVDSAIRQDM